MSESTIQPELVSLQAKLAGEIERDEKQAELILKRIEKNKALLHAVNGSLGALVAEATGYGALTDNIRAVIKSFQNAQFTAIDVDRGFRQNFPTAPMNKAAIRTCLWNLSKRDEIKCVKPGNNREPAIYERPAATVRTRRRNADAAHGTQTLLSVNGERAE
jgi:hypothetical protein